MFYLKEQVNHYEDLEVHVFHTTSSCTQWKKKLSETTSLNPFTTMSDQDRISPYNIQQ